MVSTSPCEQTGWVWDETACGDLDHCHQSYPCACNPEADPDHECTEKCHAPERTSVDTTDPTHGRIDRDIQAQVEAMNPSSIGQRVAMENTLQQRRDHRQERTSVDTATPTRPGEIPCPSCGIDHPLPIHHDAP